MPAPPDPTGPPAPPIPPNNGDVLGAEASGTRLSLHKSANAKTVTPGKQITFRLRVRNVGEARADDVRVCDRLPRGLDLVHAPGFRRSGGRLCRSLGHVGIGRARVVYITTRATRSAPLSVTNVATASASNARRVQRARHCRRVRAMLGRGPDGPHRLLEGRGGGGSTESGMLSHAAPRPRRTSS